MMSKRIAEIDAESEEEKRKVNTFPLKKLVII